MATGVRVTWQGMRSSVVTFETQFNFDTSLWEVLPPTAKEKKSLKACREKKEGRDAKCAVFLQV